MSQENVETVRRLYAAWLADDYETVFETYDPKIKLNPDPEAAWVGINDEYVRHAGVRRYMAAVYQAFEGYRPEIEDVIGLGDGRVLTLAIEHGRGRGSGATVAAHHTAHVWTMRANKAVRLDLYLDRAQAPTAAGLRD